MLYIFLFQSDQDHLAKEEFIESIDDDANPEETLWKEGKNQQREEESICGQNCSNRSCGYNAWKWKIQDKTFVKEY